MREFIRNLAGPKVKQDNKEIRPQDRRGQHRDKGGGHHAGLLLQRYLCEDGNPEEKRAILQAAINAAVNEEVRALYRIAFDRWSASLPSDPAPVDLATTGRLIVGLGSENVLETGIRLHHTYGMPILPGSALKGLAAHYCDQFWGPTDKKFKKPTKTEDEAHRKFLAGKGPKPEDNFHRLLFGNTDDSGCITFHDAWLTLNSPEPLVLDVMTPHHPKWLDGSVAPTDFDSPKPVPFLSVSGRFRVAVSWNGPASDKAKNWSELALSLLCAALEDWGIGGKTSSGYGRLVAKTATPKATGGSVTAQRTTTLPENWDTVDASIVADPKNQGRLFARHEQSGLVGVIQKSEGVPEQERQLDTALRLIVAMISTDGKQIQFLYPTPANQQRAQQAKQPPSRGKPPGKRGMR